MGDIDQLSLFWMEVTEMEMATEIARVLADPDALFAECDELFERSLSTANPGAAHLPVTRVGEITQRVIYRLGCRDEDVLGRIAQVFEDVSSGLDRDGMGPLVFRGYIASVLTQILRELEDVLSHAANRASDPPDENEFSDPNKDPVPVMGRLLRGALRQASGGFAVMASGLRSGVVDEVDERRIPAIYRNLPDATEQSNFSSTEAGGLMLAGHEPEVPTPSDKPEGVPEVAPVDPGPRQSAWMSAKAALLRSLDNVANSIDLAIEPPAHDDATVETAGDAPVEEQGVVTGASESPIFRAIVHPAGGQTDGWTKEAPIQQDVPSRDETQDFNGARDEKYAQMPLEAHAGASDYGRVYLGSWQGVAAKPAPRPGPVNRPASEAAGFHAERQVPQKLVNAGPDNSVPHADEVAKLVKRTGISVYAYVGRAWEPRNVRISRDGRHLRVSSEMGSGPDDDASFALATLDKMTRHSSPGRHCIWLQFEEGVLSLRFSYQQFLCALIDAILQDRRIPVLEARPS